MPKRKLTKRFITSLSNPDKTVEYYDTQTKGLILRVTKTGTKTFSYRYYDDGRHQRFTIGRYPANSLQDAKDEVQRIKVRRLDGESPQEERKEKRDSAKFRELADEYKKKHLRTLRESTSTEYERIIDVELIPELGSYSVGEIGKTHILRFLDDKAYSDGAVTMANYIRRVLSSIYSFGVKRGYVDVNPVSKTSPYEDTTKQPDSYYSEEDIKELWKFFGEQNQPMGELLKILMLTGQRKTETASMKWSDIKRDIWTIPGELAKNGKPHEVPLGKIAQGILDDLKPYSGNSEYVFLSTRSDGPLKSTKNAASRARKETEVTDFKVKNIRRTVATHMAKLGVDRTVVGKVLNHTQGSQDDLVTAIYDRHSYLEEKRKALQKWELEVYRMLGASSMQLMLLRDQMGME